VKICMRTSLVFVIILFIIGCSCGIAYQPAVDEDPSDIPSLVGYWIVESKGAVLM